MKAAEPTARNSVDASIPASGNKATLSPDRPSAPAM
jgi:hypothetical protein